MIRYAVDTPATFAAACRLLGLDQARTVEIRVAFAWTPDDDTPLITITYAPDVNTLHQLVGLLDEVEGQP